MIYDSEDAVELSQNAEVKGETEKALFVQDVTQDFRMAPFWLPKAVIHDDSEVYKKETTGKLLVKYWFAEKEGWV